MRISLVRQGIADALGDLVAPAGAASIVVLPYVPDSVGDVPCIFVQPEELTFDRAMNRGLDELTLTVTAYVSRSDDVASQEQLDELTTGSGPSSVKAAIEAARGAPGERALGGACDDLHVTVVRAYQWYVHGAPDVRYLGAQWTVRALGRGETPDG